MEYLTGINPVLEALRRGKRVERLLLKKGLHPTTQEKLLDMAKKEEIFVEYLKLEDLTNLTGTSSHQGVVARTYPRESFSLEGLLSLLKEKEVPLVVILDQIQDPQNLGAIIRSAYLLGAHGVIIPKDRSAGLTEAVSRASAGALEYIPVVKVTNIVRTMEWLKEAGLWMVGAASKEGDAIFKQELHWPIGLVIGNESRGLRHLVKKHCDFLVNIPILPPIDSLNASVAAGIFLYEIRRQALCKKR